ncbi:uncharacterized protein [Musca autumnalis]|uniref:uncharacterized protein n=1 Tax=Musca autumnalis TaxID=221902 RepID=UPI003CEBB8B3
MYEHVYNMHTAADREHRCDICGHCSSSPSALYQHKRNKHQFERTYKCTVCEKTFTTNFSLKDHMTAAHTGTGKYKCEHCESIFKHYSSYFLHRKRFHPLEYAERKVKRTRPTPLKECKLKVDDCDAIQVKNELIDDDVLIEYDVLPDEDENNI